MQAKILIFIKRDPRISHKPVEALRLAAGLAASKIDVQVDLGDHYKMFNIENSDKLVN